MFEIVVPIVILICLFVIFYTGFFLLYRMFKTKLFNLFGLGLFFILYGTQLLGEFIPFGVFRIFIPQLCLLFLIIFIKYTFYKDSKSRLPALQILFFFILRILEIVYIINFDFQIPLKTSIGVGLIPIFYSYIIILALEISLPMFWLGYKALDTYHNFKPYDIEPWVKKRYQLIAISSFFLGSSSYANFLIPYEGGYEAVNPVLFLLIASALLIFSFGNLIAWVMPSAFKKYFNRGYQPKEEEILSEKELKEKIKKKVSGGHKNGNN